MIKTRERFRFVYVVKWVFTPPGSKKLREEQYISDVRYDGKPVPFFVGSTDISNAHRFDTLEEAHTFVKDAKESLFVTKNITVFIKRVWHTETFSVSPQEFGYVFYDKSVI